MLDKALKQDLLDWLICQGLESMSLTECTDGFCQRLIDGGVSLKRFSMGSDLLHPVHFGIGLIWEATTGQAREEYYSTKPEEGNDNEGWLKSPFYRLMIEDKNFMRIPLNEDFVRGEMPLVDRFMDEGGTDYFAGIVRYGHSAVFGDAQGVALSWLTDRESGFTDDEIALFESVTRPFSLAYKSISTMITGQTVLQTYLGNDAATRVLDGDIRRGMAETVDAVLWFSDLQNFTRIADTLPRDRLMAFLNDYTELSVDVIHRHGGQVLKFMGDGILAMFPRADNEHACDNALDAAVCLVAEMQSMNGKRRSLDLHTTDFRLGLHRGEVLYGNIGSAERLDFTTIGPAVNEIARIESMCRALDQTIVISSAFAQSSTLSPGRVVSLGRYALRGVARPQELFTIDPEALAD